VGDGVFHGTPVDYHLAYLMAGYFSTVFRLKPVGNSLCQWAIRFGKFSAAEYHDGWASKRPTRLNQLLLAGSLLAGKQAIGVVVGIAFCVLRNLLGN
jgi:hypothetical protein